MALLPGESELFSEGESSEKAPPSDREINERYISGEVRIVTEQARYPLTTIPNMVEGPDYELNPEFQRRHRWSNEKKSKLIESFIMNVPIPPIFLYEDRYGHYEVMDGLQRLTAIHNFYRDRFALEGLEEWEFLNGRTYSQLPEQVRRGVDRRYLSSIILLQETAKSQKEAARLKQLVFERINSGGEKLSPQESRNAIYAGDLNKLCLKLARNEHLCATWRIPPQSETERQTGAPGDADPVLENSLYKNMGDAELVLRFFAYRQQLDQQAGRPLKEYLDDYLRRGNLLEEATLSQMSDLFESTIELVHETLGNEAFMLWRSDSRGQFRFEQRPTLAAYDPIMWAFSHYLDKGTEVRKATPSLRKAVQEYYEATKASFSGRTANPADIRIRNRDFFVLLGRVISQ